MRLTIQLPDEARLRLAQLARAERRPVRAQAEVLLLKALGLWPLADDEGEATSDDNA